MHSYEEEVGNPKEANPKNTVKTQQDGKDPPKKRLLPLEQVESWKSGIRPSTAVVTTLAAFDLPRNSAQTGGLGALNPGEVESLVDRYIFEGHSLSVSRYLHIYQISLRYISYIQVISQWILLISLTFHQMSLKGVLYIPSLPRHSHSMHPLYCHKETEGVSGYLHRDWVLRYLSRFL